MTPTQAKLLAAIREHTVDGVPPNYDLLASAMGWVSRGNVLRVLALLRADGLVAWDRGRTRSLRILADGPSRAAMERWSDAEILRVQFDLQQIQCERRDPSRGRLA